MNEAEIRALFPGARNQVYLNSAAQGLLPLPAAERMRTIAELHVDLGINAYPRYLQEIGAARSAAARLIGTQPERIAFTAHTTAGLATVAQGLSWREGDEVVLADVEFPANVYPWASLRRRGVKLKFVRAVEGRTEAESYLEALGPRTRVLAVSHVQFSSGYRVDLRPLGEACAACGILFCVDAIQSLGVLPLDVQELGIGVLAADGRKWLLGPTGCGFLYVAPEWTSKIAPTAPGAWSVKEGEGMLHYADHIDRQGQLDLEPLLRDDAGRYECGYPNITGLAGFGAALELGETIGRERIRGRIATLVERFVANLDEAGLAIYGPRRAEERSGILSFAVPGDPDMIFKRLQAEGYSIAVREGRLRVAPHLFNTLEEVDAVVERIRHHLAKA